MICFQNVFFTYPSGVCALQDISFSIEKSEFVFVVGPTGGGKSSVLKLIYLDEYPHKGKIIVQGRDITKLKPFQIPYLRRNIGIVFQDFKLLEEKTVEENVAYALRVIGASHQEIARQVPKVLDLVGLAHKAKMKPTELSWGEQQKVCIARALVNNPPILLCDEPTGNLDPETSYEIMQLLEKINQRGTTIVMATHNKFIVNKLKKRVITIVNSCLVSDKPEGEYYYDF